MPGWPPRPGCRVRAQRCGARRRRCGAKMRRKDAAQRCLFLSLYRNNTLYAGFGDSNGSRGEHVRHSALRMTKEAVKRISSRSQTLSASGLV